MLVPRRGRSAGGGGGGEAKSMNMRELLNAARCIALLAVTCENLPSRRGVAEGLRKAISKCLRVSPCLDQGKHLVM